MVLKVFFSPVMKAHQKYDQKEMHSLTAKQPLFFLPCDHFLIFQPWKEDGRGSKLQLTILETSLCPIELWGGEGFAEKSAAVGGKQGTGYQWPLALASLGSGSTMTVKASDVSHKEACPQLLSWPGGKRYDSSLGTLMHISYHKPVQSVHVPVFELLSLGP